MARPIDLYLEVLQILGATTDLPPEDFARFAAVLAEKLLHAPPDKQQLDVPAKRRA